MNSPLRITPGEKMTVLREFFESLNLAEEKFRKSIASDNIGLLFRSAINELDWYHYNLKRTEHPTEISQENFYILQLGVVRLIKLSFESRASFDAPVVTFTRRPELTIPTLEVVSALGIIQHGRRVAQSVMSGIGYIKKSPDNKFDIILPEDILDEAYYEREVARHFFDEHRRSFLDAIKSKQLKKLNSEISSLLNSLVYTWENHFIGYETDPLLDEFFFGLAYSEIMCHEGFDSFHYQVKFGNVRFQNYILALTCIISIFNKHEKFAEALINKDSSVQLENILTISSETSGFIESLVDAVNHFGQALKDSEQIDISQAKTIFKVLSCGRSDTHLIDAPGAPVPFMIRCSEDGFIRCVTGIKSEPVRYLLDSLRFHYPKEYADHQQSRELSMQRAIRRVLNDTISELEYRNNLILRLDGKLLTDVDLVVLEIRTGLVIFCQLKHQELYGADLHAKRIRGNRLKKEVGDWIRAVDGWLAATDRAKIRASLQLPKNFPEPIFRKLIISKHYSHPLRDIISHENEYHCNWPHFFNATLITKNRHTNPKLEEFLRVVYYIQTELKIPTHLQEPNTKWTVGDLTFITRQQEGVNKGTGST